MSDGIQVVLCTAPDAEQASRLARGVVNARLAACVNVLPGIRSFYHWDGAVQDDAEVQLVIKTASHRIEALFAWLNANHPYDVPEILALEVGASSEAYGRWVLNETA